MIEGTENRLKKLAIITTHPIQYNAPWFRLLVERKVIRVKVFYTWSQTEKEEKFDPGFGKVIEWDIPLLEGYDCTFVKNISKQPGSKKYSGINNPSLIDEINNWKPDALLVFGWNFNSHLKAIRHFHKRIPVLFRGDSTLLDEQKGWKQIARRILLKWVYRHIDYSLFVGTQNKNYFLKHGMKENQLIFAPHAIDNKRFAQSALAGEEKAVAIRASLNIKANSIVLMYAGKMEETKNLEILLEALKSMNMDTLHLVMVGNGVLEHKLKRMAREIKNVHFASFQNQSALPVYFNLCDIFVLPSKGETWGLAVNEAMACGKPVLVSDKCGCATDLVEDGVTGYTFKSGDVLDLQQKLQSFIEQKSQLKKMGAHAAKKISNWSFEKIAEAVEQTAIKNS